MGKIKACQAEVIDNDPIEAYLLAYTSFDGSLSHGIQFCATRVVCANTLAKAQNEGQAASGFKLRHTQSIQDKLDKVQMQIDCAKRDFSRSIDTYRDLQRKKVNADWARRYAETLFLRFDADKKPTAQSQNKVISVLDILLASRDLEKVPANYGTAWEAYNGVTRYLTHHAGRSDDSRLNSQWFGEAANINNQALALAARM